MAPDIRLRISYPSPISSLHTPEESCSKSPVPCTVASDRGCLCLHQCPVRTPPLSSSHYLSRISFTNTEYTECHIQDNPSHLSYPVSESELFYPSGHEGHYPNILPRKSIQNPSSPICQCSHSYSDRTTSSNTWSPLLSSRKSSKLLGTQSISSSLHRLKYSSSSLSLDPYSASSSPCAKDLSQLPSSCDSDFQSSSSSSSCPLRTSKSRTSFFSHRWVLLPLVLAFCLPKEARCGQHERRLLHDLLDNYNPLERPVANESDPVQVSFGITLQQIIDVDEKNQLLITNTWLKLEWNDVNLKWNETDYGGVKDLRIPPYKIWKPDVLMYNSADEGFDGTYQTKVVVSSDGSCLYIPPGIFKSTCKIDITWFPFDDQRCKMKFGSWTYSGWQLDLQLQSEAGGDLSDFIKNGEWDLIGCPGHRNAIFYQCCPEPYVDVTFEIVIRRRTLYYFCNLILPCVLIASMAVLGFTLPPDCGEKLSLDLPGARNVINYNCCPEPYVDVTFYVVIRRRTVYYLYNLILPCVLISSMSLLGFSLPPESGEKLTLGVTILLSLTVFTSMVNDSIPSTSDAVPLLGVTVLLSLTVFLDMVRGSMPTTSESVPLIGVTILLSLTVFSNMVNDTMPVTSDAVPLLGVTILLSLTVFHNIVTETLPQVSDAMPVLGVAVLLALCVFSELVNELLPQSSTPPLIGTYFNCIMFMVASSVVSTVLILNYHHRSAETHVMSPMVKSVFLQWMPWILRMHRPGEKITRKTILMNNKMKELELKVTPSLLLQERSSKSLLANVLDIDDDFRAHTLPHSHNTNNTASFLRLPHGGHSVDDSHLVHTCMSACTRELNLILKEIRVITDKMRKEEEEEEVTHDWRFAAMVVDRLCLIIFTMFTITATVAVLLSAPHIIVP